MKNTLIATVLAGLALTSCAGIRQSNDNEPSATYRPLPKTANLPDRSFYDSSNPQPHAFYDWMDKVSALAFRVDVNIDGDSEFFVKYWKGGLTPAQALQRYRIDPWPNNGGALNATKSDDGFESWMARVYKIAPRYHLKLHPNDELLTATEREWFHLYYWQKGVSPEKAVRATYNRDFLNHDISVRQPLFQ